MEFNFTKLKGLMAEHGYTNESLSKKIGISHVYISEFKNGKRQPSIELINKMVKVFKLKNYTILIK